MSHYNWTGVEYCVFWRVEHGLLLCQFCEKAVTSSEIVLSSHSVKTMLCTSLYLLAR